MSRSAPPSRPSDDDYQAIEAAVMETARGRWFLSEYARRNRSADTASILEAITQLEELAAPLEDAPDVAQLRALLNTLAETRAATWQGVADKTGRPAHQRPRQAADSAVAAVRRAAEKIREVAFELRETARMEIYANALDLYCADLSGAATLSEGAVRRLADLAALVAKVESRLSVLLGEDDPIHDGERAPAPAKQEAPPTAPEPAPAPAVAAAKEPVAETPKAKSPATPPANFTPVAAALAPALAEPAPAAQPKPAGAEQPRANGDAKVLMFINPA